jgi:DeoR/GlpR family transcriptional regulator of sugar metabolism
MIPQQRRETIVKELQQKKICTVTELRKLLDVSEVTVHRDLVNLEQSGVIKKVHGGATIVNPPTGEDPKAEQRVDIRLNMQVEEKMEIARKAVQLIRDESSIFIDHSSTSIYVARELKALSLENLVLVTNSLRVLSDLEGCTSINLISTGGILQHQWGALGGQSTLDFLSRLNFDQIFISCGGISIERGLMTAFSFIAESLKMAATVTREINLLVDHSKFSKRCTFPIMPVTSLTRIITDRKLEPAIAERYRNIGIEII